MSLRKTLCLDPRSNRTGGEVATAVRDQWGSICHLLLVVVISAILTACGGAPSEDGGGPADGPDVSGPGGDPGDGGSGDDGSDDSGDSGGDDNMGGDEPPLDRQAQHELTMSLMASSELGCANCHSASDGQRGNLNLETGTLEELAARLVMRRSASDNCTDELLIDADDPDSSLFLHLVSPTISTPACIAKMPLGSNGVSAENYEVLIEWVDNLIATYREQDDDDFDVGGGDDDNTSGIVTSEVATPADPLEVLMRIKYLVTGTAVTRDELDAATNGDGALDAAGFDTLVEDWLASEDFTSKRQSFFELALQQNPADKNYVQQLRNSRNLMPGDVVRNLEASLIRTAERIYSDGEDFRSLFWTTRHEVTTATLMVYKMLDNPIMRPRTGSFDKGNPINSLAEAIRENYEGRSDPMFQSDQSDWRTVELRYAPESTDMREPDGFSGGSNLEILRGIGDEGVVTLRTPRVLCSTPSILQMWQTNRDNRFRALVNQCLIMAVGASFATGDPTVPDVHPLPGVDTEQIPEGTECMGCHKNMDPMLSAFEAHFDYDHQRYRPRSQDDANFYRELSGEYYNYDPASRRNYFPFESFPLPYFSYQGVNEPGVDLFSLVRQMAEHEDFAEGWALKVCSWASSVPCSRRDPEIARIATEFANSGFQLDRLFHAFFTSKLATHSYKLEESKFPGSQVSIARRDHFCQAIKVRLREVRRAQDRTDGNINQNTDLCASNRSLSEAVPEASVQRGATGFNLPTSNTPFSSISVANLCSSNLSALVGGGSRTFSDNSNNAAEMIELIVSKMYGFPERTQQYDDTIASLTQVYDLYRRSTPQCANPSSLRSALDGSGPACGLALSDRDSMESIVSLACQSPALTALGL